MRGALPALPRGALDSLELRVRAALASADASGLEVLGWGEISSVLALRFEGGGAACKRLPPFPSERAFEAYRSCLEAQLRAFEDGGIPVLATGLERLPRTSEGPVAYCVQPLVEREALLPARIAQRTEAQGREWVERVIDLSLAYVSPARGFDAQLSNWALVDGALVYLDVTTPLLRDEQGRERLDLELFLASLPWALRGLVRRFMLKGILDPYYTPRGVLLDLLGNLFKEGLGDRLPALVPAAARRLEEGLSLEDVRRHYARDARTWRFLQRLRRLDRAWQRRLRRRPYPFLLPGLVERHV